MTLMTWEDLSLDEKLFLKFIRSLNPYEQAVLKKRMDDLMAQADTEGGSVVQVDFRERTDEKGDAS